MQRSRLTKYTPSGNPAVALDGFCDTPEERLETFPLLLEMLAWYEDHADLNKMGWIELLTPDEKNPQEFWRDVRHTGDTLWVVERDLDNKPRAIYEYVFVSRIAGYVICAPKVFGRADLPDVMKMASDNTQYDDGTGILSVFPQADCFPSLDEAKKAAFGGDNITKEEKS